MGRHWAGRAGYVLPTAVAVVAVLALMVVGWMVSTAEADRPARPGAVELVGGDRSVTVTFDSAGPGSAAHAFEVSLNDSQWLPLDAQVVDGRMSGRVDGLLPGTTYEARVRVVSAGGTSPPSPVTPSSRASTSGAALRVEAEAAAADGDVVVTFTGDGDAQEGLDGWRVVAQPDDPALGPQQAVCEVGSTSCAVRGLVDGEAYQLAVTPFSSLLPGSLQLRTVDGVPFELGQVTGRTAEAEAPQDLAAVPLDGALELVWTMPRGSVARGERFEVAVGSESDPQWVALDVSRGDGRFTATVSGLDNGETTRVAVRVAGGSQPGAVATVEGRPAGPPSRVRDAEATTRGTTATLRWKAPRDTGGASVRTYVVSGYDGPGCTTRRTTCTVRGIDPRRPARFVISADNTTDGQPDTGLGPAVPVRSAGPRR